MMKELTPGPCSGCSCTAPSVTCTATLASYATSALCNTTSNNGVPAGTLSSTDGCSKPMWSSSTTFNAWGVAAGAFTATPNGSCTPSGFPTAATPTWGVTSRFCATNVAGGGCEAGETCVPATATAAPRCQMSDSRSCGPGQILDAWYTGYQGTQTCGPCGCAQTAAASCNAVTITIGSDRQCSPAVAILTSSNRRACFLNSVKEPAVQFMGPPTRPTCQGTSAPGTGTLVGTGQKTVCCVP
jgi:hypothetical protein